MPQIARFALDRWPSRHFHQEPAPCPATLRNSQAWRGKRKPGGVARTAKSPLLRWTISPSSRSDAERIRAQLAPRRNIHRQESESCNFAGKFPSTSNASPFSSHCFTNPVHFPSQIRGRGSNPYQRPHPTDANNPSAMTQRFIPQPHWLAGLSGLPIESIRSRGFETGVSVSLSNGQSAWFRREWSR